MRGLSYTQAPQRYGTSCAGWTGPCDGVRRGVRVRTRAVQAQTVAGLAPTAPDKALCCSHQEAAGDSCEEPGQPQPLQVVLHFAAAHHWVG